MNATEETLQRVMALLTDKEIKELILPVVIKKITEKIERDMDDVYFADWFIGEVLTDEVAEKVRKGILANFRGGVK